MRINKNYGRLIDGVLAYAPHKLQTAAGDLFTNDAALLLTLGYKTVVKTPMPAAPGKIAVMGAWTETETAIVQTWTLADAPADEGTAYGQIIDTLTGEA